MQTAADFQRQLHALKEDRQQGASELARLALRILAESALHGAAGGVDQLRDLLRRRAEILMGARPSMAPMYNLLQRWQSRLAELDAPDPEGFRRGAAEAAEALVEASARAVKEAAQHARVQLAGNRTIITHSLSSTVLQVFRQLRGSDTRVIVTESRPLNEGCSLAAKLSQWGIATELITEAQMGLFVKTADAAIVGADSLLADGSLVNKAGTYLLALAARDQGLSFYTCCESFKLRTPAMGEPELEEMEPAELKAPDMPGVEVRNVYFDITPPHLISGWITEHGPVRDWTGRL